MGEFAIYHWLIVLAAIVAIFLPCAILALVALLFVRWQRKRRSMRAPEESPGAKGPW